MKKLNVVGIGPGDRGDLTLKAVGALENADLIIGYTTYVNLVKEWYPDKEYLDTPMTKEIERCELALEKASEGMNVALVSDGDPGVYGMAGPVLELAEKYPDVDIDVIPGVTAAVSGAAMLGAPLTHDFAVISLSDRLTSRDTIGKRLRAAAESDFCICIYNPSSSQRAGFFEKACGILLEYEPGDRVCGVVKNIGRAGEERSIMTLDKLAESDPDMITTIFIGNSATKVTQNDSGNFIVTQRGYGL